MKNMQPCHCTKREPARVSFLGSCIPQMTPAGACSDSSVCLSGLIWLTWIKCTDRPAWRIWRRRSPWPRGNWASPACLIQKVTKDHPLGLRNNSLCSFCMLIYFWLKGSVSKSIDTISNTKIAPKSTCFCFICGQHVYIFNYLNSCTVTPLTCVVFW